jgi:hypothetical protein
VLELGDLTGVTLSPQLSLERGALSVRLARQTVKALDRGLCALVGLLGALGLLAGELGILDGGLALDLSLADLLQRAGALLVGFLHARKRVCTISLGLLGSRQRLIGLLAT